MSAPYQITRKIEFDAAHRVPRHESKCRALHGHRYVVEVCAQARDLDEAGRVIDFGELKEILGGWIDQHWDHTTILDRADTLSDALSELQLQANPQKPVYLLGGPPTAEVMARELFQIASQLFQDRPIQIVKIRLWETPNCFAEWAA